MVGVTSCTKESGRWRSITLQDFLKTMSRHQLSSGALSQGQQWRCLLSLSSFTIAHEIIAQCFITFATIQQMILPIPTCKQTSTTFRHEWMSGDKHLCYVSARQWLSPMKEGPNTIKHVSTMVVSPNNILWIITYLKLNWTSHWNTMATRQVPGWISSSKWLISWDHIYRAQVKSEME